MHLHLSNDEDAAPPLEWMVSRICEEFGCLPSAAIAEVKRDRSILDILEMRTFARTIEAMKTESTAKDIPDRQRVWAMGIIQRSIQMRRERQQG